MNSKRTNVILGEKTTVLWGNEVIYDFIGNVKFAISALSFYQVNPVQTKVLYDKALEYAGLKGDETVIDAYCGIGTISLFFAQKAKKVFGVEVVPEAIEDARRNAELNEFTNVEFAAGEAEVVIPKWYEEGNSADVLVVDPPRKGCDESFLQTIIETLLLATACSAGQAVVNPDEEVNSDVNVEEPVIGEVEKWMNLLTRN